MKVFITGATGLLGNNLVRECLGRGWEVTALVRSEEKARRQFGDSGVRFVVGDMENVAAFSSELTGHDVLFHTAAYFREYYQPGEDHWAKLRRINIDATIEILSAADAAGVKKAIYVSSSGVIGPKPNGSAGDETSRPHRVAESNLYFKSKVLAEAAVEEWGRSRSMPVVQILPGWMFGVGDAAPTSAGQLVLDYLAGNLPGTFEGGTTTVDAADVAWAMAEAALKAPGGEKYIVAGRFETMRSIAKTMSEVTGRSEPGIRFPYFAIYSFAVVQELISRITGRPALITRTAIDTMTARLDHDSSKAVRELGVTFRPFPETMRAVIDWYRANGYAN